MRRSTRFVRLLAIGSACAACSTTPNADHIDADRIETGGDGGSCVDFFDADLHCGSGLTCLVDDTTDADLVVCRHVESTLLHPCGDITCGWNCICGDAAASMCGCVTGISGPMFPPELVDAHA